MDIGIELVDADQIQDLLRQAPEIVEQEINRSVEESTMMLKREIKDATPVVTNLLRGSIESKVEEYESLGEQRISEGQSGLLSDEVIGSVSTSINYAIPVELGVEPFSIGTPGEKGHRNNPGFEGRKMFTNTMNKQQGAVETIFSSALERIVERISNTS